MTDLQVRDAVPADLPVLMELYHAAVHGLTAELYGAEQRQAWAPAPLREDYEHWRRRLGGLEILVGLRAEQPAGFCAFSLSGHIDLLYTHPDHARRGVARRLLHAAEERLRRAGVLRATTGASRLSRPLFEQQGYLATGEEVVEVRGARLPHTNMHRFL